MEQLVIWVNNSSYSPWSRVDAKGWIKRFYRRLRLGTYLGEFPEEVAWIKTRVKQNELTEPEILTDEEVERMLARATALRESGSIDVGSKHEKTNLHQKTRVDILFDNNIPRQILPCSKSILRLLNHLMNSDQCSYEYADCPATKFKLPIGTSQTCPTSSPIKAE